MERIGRKKHPKNPTNCIREEVPKDKNRLSYVCPSFSDEFSVAIVRVPSK
jgi:hypothetical protein